MGYLAIQDKNWGSVVSSKEPITMKHLSDFEKGMLKQMEALHKKVSTKETKGKILIQEKTFGSVVSNKEAVTHKHLSDLEKNMLKQMETLHKKVLAKEPKSKKNNK